MIFPQRFASRMSHRVLWRGSFFSLKVAHQQLTPPVCYLWHAFVGWNHWALFLVFSQGTEAIMLLTGININIEVVCDRILKPLQFVLGFPKIPHAFLYSHYNFPSSIVTKHTSHLRDSTIILMNICLVSDSKPHIASAPSICNHFSAEQHQELSNKHCFEEVTPSESTKLGGRRELAKELRGTFKSENPISFWKEAFLLK